MSRGLMTSGGFSSFARRRCRRYVREGDVFVGLVVSSGMKTQKAGSLFARVGSRRPLSSEARRRPVRGPIGRRASRLPWLARSSRSRGRRAEVSRRAPRRVIEVRNDEPKRGVEERQGSREGRKRAVSLKSRGRKKCSISDLSMGKSDRRNSPEKRAHALPTRAGAGVDSPWR